MSEIPSGFNLSVWKVTYSSVGAERVSTCGGMDSELTGRTVKYTASRIIVAPTEEIVRAAFHAKDSHSAIDSIEVLGRVDQIVRLDNATHG